MNMGKGTGVSARRAGVENIGQSQEVVDRQQKTRAGEVGRGQRRYWQGLPEV